VLVLAAGAALGAGVAPAAGYAATSLRIVPSFATTTTYAYRGSALVDLGMVVTPVGGDLEIRASRASYEVVPTVTQTDPATGSVVQTFGPGSLRGWRGLRRFFEITATTPTGELAELRHIPFCPTGTERISDAAPVTPRYPSLCGSQIPFVRGMVWGLELGWASEIASIVDGAPAMVRLNLAPGHYKVTVEIAEPYRSLFRVSPADASESVDVIVKDGSKRRAGQVARVRAMAGRELQGIPPTPAVPTVTTPDPATLPDLVALPPWDFEITHWNRTRELLSFAASPWNAGPGPLVVEGFRRPGEPAMDAFQYYYDASQTAVARTTAGSLVYDARRGHDHWHFLQFARYDLRNATTGALVRSTKQAFCLAPTDAIDLTVPQANWTPWTSNITSVCAGRSATWIREALLTGWADTYYQTVAGQAFDVTDLPAGRYRISITVNPLGLLQEASTANNTADRIVFLRGHKGAHKLRVVAWHGLRG
jgi:hypothetical protein